MDRRSRFHPNVYLPVRILDHRSSHRLHKLARRAVFLDRRTSILALQSSCQFIVRKKCETVVNLKEKNDEAALKTGVGAKLGNGPQMGSADQDKGVS